MKKVFLFLFFLASFFNLFAQQHHQHKANEQNEKYPIKFFENKNQWDEPVKYRAELPAGYLFLRANALQYSFYDAKKWNELRPVHGTTEKHQVDKIISEDATIKAHSYLIEFIGANPKPKLIPNHAFSGKHHYYLGNDKSKWASNVKTFAQVTYQNLYDNIDMKLYATESNFKYEFLLAANTDPSIIRMNYTHAEKISIEHGNLIVKTTVNEVMELKPYSYQIIDGEKVEIASKFVVEDKQVYFEFPKGYNQNLPLVIDPDLVFATYSGSNSPNFGNSATYGENGYLYTTGIVNGNDFPTTVGAFDVSYNDFFGDWDVGVLKFDSLGQNLLYGAYLGGNNTETGHSILMNDQNELLIMGSTSSTDFPTSASAFQTTFQGGSFVSSGSSGSYFNGSDIFITRLSPDGSAILASTYLGGSGNDGLGLRDALVKNYGDDHRGDIIADSLGNIHIISSSASANFPIVGTGTSFGGGTRDAVVVKMPEDLSSITWSAFLGGSDTDSGNSIKITSNGDVFVAGGTESNNFNPTIGAAIGGSSDAYVAKYDLNGNLLASRLLGTNSYDQAFFIDLDGDENLYVLGEAQGSYPVSAGVYSNSGSGHFIQKMSNDLNNLVLSTVIGQVNGGIDMSLTAFLVTECGDISLAGWASSLNGTNSFGFPVTPDAFDDTTGGEDFYLMVLGNQMQQLTYGSYFGESGGGAHVDGGTSRFHKDGTVYQALCACDGGLPVTPGAFSNTSNAYCNNAAFKFAIPPMEAEFEIEDVNNANTIITQACVPAVITLENTSEGGQNFLWEVETQGVLNVEDNTTTYTFNTAGTYEIKLTVTDDRTCLAESVFIQTLEVLDNTDATLTATLPLNTATLCYETEVIVGETLYFELNADDLDLDTLEITAEGVGFNMNSVGMNFNSPRTIPIVSASFSWSPDCSLLPAGLDSVIYELKFEVDERKECSGATSTTDEICVNILLRLPENTAPIVSSSLIYDVVEDVYYDSLEINNHFNFTFDVEDSDNDNLTIDFVSGGFDMATLGATFTPTSGNTSINASFDWDILCQHLIPITSASRTEYFFDAIVKDYDICTNVRSMDTTRIKLILLPNPNTEPIVSSSLIYDVVEDIYYDSLEINNHFNFTFDVEDSDNDNLTIEFAGDGFDMTTLGATFTPTSGNTSINASFDWDILCQHLIPITSASRTEYFFDAIIKDYDLCNNVRSTDTARIKLILLPNPNTEPILSSSLVYDAPLDIYRDTVIITDFTTFTFDINDTNGDSLTFEVQGQGFDMTSAGMTFTPNSGTGVINTQFDWQTFCHNAPPDQDSLYILDAIIKDYDLCGNVRSLDTTQFHILVVPPNINSLPILSSSLVYDAPLDIYRDTVIITDFTTFTFDINDSNGDSLTFEVQGQGFDMTSAGMTFTPNSGTGVLNAQFDWQILCEHGKVDQDSLYVLNAVIKDYDLCGNVRSRDTTQFHILVVPPNVNILPIHTSSLVYDSGNDIYRDTVTITETTSFTFDITDGNNDSITLELQGNGFDLATEGMTFTPNSGTGVINATFDWQTLCRHALPEQDSLYVFDAIIKDYDICGNVRSFDTTQFHILVVPPNINSLPILSSSLVYDAPLDVYRDTVIITDFTTFTFDINDTNGDSLTFEVQGQGFDMTSAGMTFTPNSGTGVLNAQFDWQTFCHNARPQQDSLYILDAIIKDYDICGNVRSLDTTQFHILVVPPNINSLPILSSSLVYDVPLDVYRDTVIITDFTTFTFDINDTNGDSLTFEVQGQGFDMTSAGMTFTPNSGTGVLNAQFDWQTLCEHTLPDQDSLYILDAIIKDYDICGNVRSRDTTQFHILVVPPNINSLPISSSSLVYDAPLDVYRDTVIITDFTTFTFDINDTNGDSLTFEVQGQGFDMTSAGMTFTPNSGTGVLNAQFDWQTFCHNAPPNQDSLYVLDAIIKDYDICGNVRSRDTTQFHILVVPPNLNGQVILSSSLVYDAPLDIYYDTVVMTNSTNFTFDISETNGNELTFEVEGRGFDMTSAGMTFTPNSGTGVLNAQFDWQTLCQHALPEQDSLYILDAIIKSYDICGSVRSLDTTQFHILVVPPNINSIPIMTSSLVFDIPNQIYRDTVIATELMNFTFDISDSNGDSLTFTTQGQGFDMNLEGMTFSPTSGTQSIGTSTLLSNFTWQTDCADLTAGLEKHYLFDAIISDYDICGNVRSLTTASFDILVTPPVDDIAVITSSSLHFDAINTLYFDTLQVEDLANFTFDAQDPDGNNLNLTLTGDGFTLASVGASFATQNPQQGLVNGTFTWQTDCNTLQSNDTTDFIFNAITTDFNVCGIANPSDTTQVRLTILPIINPAPIVDSAGVSNLVYDVVRDVYTVEVFFGDTLEFDMMGDDPDGDIITLSAAGQGFSLAQLEMEFEPIRDLPRVESHFKWITGCNIKDKVDYTQPYLIDFIVSDEGNCAADAADTIRVEITLKEVPNDAPEIYVDNANLTGTCYEMRVVVGDTLNFDVLATDLNQDEVTIYGSVKDFTFAELGMQFSSVTGVPASLPLSAEFTWATNFDILEDYQDSVTYNLTFVADDGNCELVEMCVKITLVNCQTPDLTGIPAISDLCAAGDTLGREIPENEDWNYWWTSDVGIDGDSTQRLIFVQKAGIYTIHVQHLADHCIYESRTIVRTDDLFLSPQDTIICKDQAPAHLIARDLAHPSNFIFEWRNLLDTSVIVQSDTTGLLEVDSSGIYLVRMTNPNGNCFITDTVQATINPNPSFDIVGYTNPVCKEPIALRIENTNITGFEVQWSVQTVDSAGYFEGSTDNLNVTVLKSGLYMATVTDTATNCETTKSIEIIINDNPIINLDVSLKDTLICQDIDFVVDAFDASHPIDAAYQWKKLSDNSIVSDSSKLVIEFEDFDKTAYEVTVTTSSSNCQSKDTIQVEFVRQTIAEITANKTGICLGDSIILSASGGDFYLWSNGDTTENSTVSPQAVGIYTYILEAQYQNACASSFDTIQLEVFPVPVLDILDSLIVCQEDTTAFLDASHSSHASNAIYKWYWVGDTTSLSDSSRIDLKFDTFQGRGFDALAPFDLIVEVSNGQNSCFATDTIKIEFSKKSVAKIDTLFKKEICLGETITLQGSGGDSLYWNTGDSTNIIRITPEKAGFERIILFANNLNACAETSDTVFVKVNPLPVIDLHELDSITICYGDTLLLTPTGGDSGHYVWQHLPSPADTIFVSPQITTTYYVFGMDSNSCQSSDSLKVIVRPTLDLPEKIQACAGDFLEIGAESPVEAEYYWLQVGFTTPTIKVKASGTYSVRVTTAECVYERSVEVNFVEYPELESTSDTTFCFEFGAEEGFADGQTHVINTTITNPDTAANYDYVWLDTAGFIVSTRDTLEVSEEGVYVVQVFDENLQNPCPVSDTIRIEAVCEPRIFIPTGFSPNEDDLNDRFTVFGKHIKNFKMEVHDRWGALIYVLERESFEDIQADEFWDGTLKGKPLPNGMYTWSIQYENPFNLKAETVNLNGQVNIVR